MTEAPSTGSSQALRRLDLALADTPAELPPVGTGHSSPAVDLLAGRLPALFAPESAAATWVWGPPGSGKTYALARHLDAVEPSVPGCRIAAYPGLRFEEVLYRIGEFLQQCLSPAFTEALAQRCGLESKLLVLHEIVAKHPVVLWLDNCELIDASDDQTEGQLFDRFLASCARLSRESRGRWLFSSSEAPLVSGLTTFEIRRPSREETLRILGRKGLGEEATEVPEGLDLVSSILQASLEEGSAAATSIRELIPLGLASLSERAATLLRWITAFRGPVTRRALREMGESEASLEGLSLDPENLDAAFGELEARGLVEMDPRPESWRLDLRNSLRSAIEAWFLSRPEPWGEQRFLDAPVLYLLRLADRRSSPWDYYRARSLLRASARRAQAASLDKSFVETFVRLGYEELVSKVLSESVEAMEGAARAVTLGNLAMIHKNRGSYDRALELYDEARRELEKLDDADNLARILHQIGNTLFLQDEGEAALEAYEASRELSLGAGQAEVAGATLVQVAGVRWALGQRARAMADYEEALGLLDREANPAMIATLRMQLGQCQLASGQYLEAETSFRDAAELSERAGDRRSLLRALRGQSAVARDQHDYDRAREHCRAAEELARNLGDLFEVIDCQVAEGDLEKRGKAFMAALERLLNALDTLDRLRDQGGIAPEDEGKVRASIRARLDGLVPPLESELVTQRLAERGLAGTSPGA